MSDDPMFLYAGDYDVYTPGIGLTGFDWFWVILAVLLDIGHWSAGYTQRSQLPGAR